MNLEEVRFTARIPKWMADFLDKAAEENFTSRNAEVVRAIRLRAQMEAGVSHQTEAPASMSNITALQGGVSVTKDERTVSDEYSR